jgi:hypothetical protein
VRERGKRGRERRKGARELGHLGVCCTGSLKGGSGASRPKLLEGVREKGEGGEEERRNGGERR